MRGLPTIRLFVFIFVLLIATPTRRAEARPACSKILSSVAAWVSHFLTRTKVKTALLNDSFAKELGLNDLEIRELGNWVNKYRGFKYDSYVNWDLSQKDCLLALSEYTNDFGG